MTYDIHADDCETGSLEHILLLAAQLDSGDEITMGPTDSNMCASALRLLAAERARFALRLAESKSTTAPQAVA